jgi:hypothetical protein
MIQRPRRSGAAELTGDLEISAGFRRGCTLSPCNTTPFGPGDIVQQSRDRGSPPRALRPTPGNLKPRRRPHHHLASHGGAGPIATPLAIDPGREASPETIRRAYAVHPITALQTEYSLFARDLEDEILPVRRELGIGLVPYSPLGRGLLTGSITTEPPAGDSRATAYFPRFQGEALEANLKLVDAIRGLADAHGCTPGQLALAWVLAQGDDVVPIPGTRRVTYLEENVGALQVRLSAADLRALADAVPRGAVVGDRYGDLSTIDR